MNLRWLLPKISWANSIALLKRFPGTLLASFMATTILIYAIETDADNSEQLVKTIVCIGLGIPFLFAIEISNERKWWNNLLAYAIGLGILILIYATSTFNIELDETKTYVLRSIMYFILAHLLVAFLPYFKNKSIVNFWHYNKHLFLSFITAAFYTATLFGGLSLAILGIENLFDLKIPEKTYAYLFIILNVFVNTLIFLSKLNRLEQIDQDIEYPTGLKMFTLYVLLPLVAIYLGILIAYEIKIVLAWCLPKGWVSYLVLASGIFGILAFLLLYPVKNLSVWIRRFHQLFYWFLLPLNLLMFAAVYIRINQYGITENRYIIALLAVWLTLISFYFIVSKKDNIKWIPISLAVFTLIAAVGPLSAFKVAKRNQENTLNALVSKYSLLEQNKLKASIKINDEQDRGRFEAALGYLAERYPQSLDQYIGSQQTDSLAKAYVYGRKDKVFKMLNYERTFEEETIRAMHTPYNALEKTYGAQYQTKVYYNKEKENEEILKNGDLNISYNFVNKRKFELSLNQEKQALDITSISTLRGEATEKETLKQMNFKEYQVLFKIENYSEVNDDSTDFTIDGTLYFIRKN